MDKTSSENRHRWYHALPVDRGIILALLIVAIIPVSLLGIRLFQVAWDNAWEETKEKQQLLAQNLTVPVKQYTHNHIAMLQVLAHAIAEGIEGMMPAGLVVHRMQDYLDFTPGFTAVTWVDTDGKVIEHVFKHTHHNEPKRIINKFLHQVITTGEWAISPLQKNFYNTEPVVIVAVPIEDSADKIHGAVFAELDLTNLEAFRKNTEFGENGFAFFVDAKMQILSHPNKILINTVSQLAAATRVVKGNKGLNVIRDSSTNEELVVSFAPVEDLGWGVIIQQPKQEIYAQFVEFIWTQLSWALVGLLLSLVIGIRISRWVTLPINRLMAASADLIKNDLNGTLPDTNPLSPLEIQNLSQTIGELTNGFRKSQNDVYDLNASLQERIDLATRRLRETNAHLEIALAQAEQASRAKGNFLANMSHELRTPMNAIIGYSEILEEIADERKLEDLLPDIRKILFSGRHLLALISDILDLSKIEAGKMQLHLDIFNIKDTFDEVLASVQPLVEKNCNTLELQFTNIRTEMFADATKVRQVLLNILSNAVKFTQNGKIEVTIKDAAEARDPFIEVVIRDNGIGISKKQMKNLFQDFSQADSSTTKKFGGTGLGLAISRRFCRMMGGDITVESELSKGSSFKVSLPVYVSDPMSNHENSPSLEPSASSSHAEIEHQQAAKRK
ncbi:MAG: ATP-binding protein [Gammaproteobacteria bacterium]|nr:ATP-binding protein [Gammaproteobacteria bacterium]